MSLLPPCINQKCQRYMERWCVANHGVPFGSRLTRADDVQTMSRPVRLYFNFDETDHIVIDRGTFEDTFVAVFPTLYPARYRPRRQTPRFLPPEIEDMFAGRTFDEDAAYADIENARFDRLQAEFDARPNK